MISLLPLVALCAAVAAADRLGPASGWAAMDAENYSYSILMDAGSTGTRLHVYRWPDAGTNEKLPANLSIPVEQGDSFKVTPGISDPEGGGLAGLATLIEDAKTKTVLSGMKDKWPEIPILLFATAGMRILDEESRDSILNQVRTMLHNSGFYYASSNQARVLSGEEEGVFGWISANYHFGHLTDGPVGDLAHTFGALDLGGASTQVSFLADEPSILSNSYDVILGQQVDQTIYTHSFLYFGMNEAERRAYQSIQATAGYPASANNPCYYSGLNLAFTDVSTGKNTTLRGTGNFTACAEVFRGLLDLSAECLTDPKPVLTTFTSEEQSRALRGQRVGDAAAAPLPINPVDPGATCSFSGVYQPPLPASRDLYAFSSFSYTWQFLGLKYNGTTMNELAAAGDALCSTSWEDVQKQHPSTPTSYLEGYCAEAAYQHTLLTAGYGVDGASKSVVVADPDASFQADWTLGAMFTLANKPWLLR